MKTGVPEPEQAEVESFKLLCVFQTGGEEYCVPLDDVREVVKLSTIAKIPQMPDYIKGMVNVRGNIYSVLDLATFFGNHSENEEHFQFLVVIKNEDYNVAIRVPNVPDTIKATDEMIENFKCFSS